MTQFPHIIISGGLVLFPALGAVGGLPAPPCTGLAVSQARGAPSSLHGPAAVAGGIIPACPGWTQVEPSLTSGTLPRGPGLPGFVRRRPRPRAGPDAVSSAALELWLLPGEAGTKPHQTLSREASGPVAQLSPFPASVSSSVAWARPPGCSWVIWGSTGAVWAEAAGGQTPSLSCRSFPRGARPGPLASPSTEPLSRKFEVAGRTDLLEA